MNTKLDKDMFNTDTSKECKICNNYPVIIHGGGYFCVRCNTKLPNDFLINIKEKTKCN